MSWCSKPISKLFIPQYHKIDSVYLLEIFYSNGSATDHNQYPSVFLHVSQTIKKTTHSFTSAVYQKLHLHLKALCAIPTAEITFCNEIVKNQTKRRKKNKTIPNPSISS